VVPVRRPGAEILSLEGKPLLVLEPDDSAKEALEALVLAHDLSMLVAHDVEDAHRQLTKGGVFAYVFNLASVGDAPMDYIKNLKQQSPEMPLIVLLGEGCGESAIECLQQGAYACFGLPLTDIDFDFVLAKLIANHTGLYNPFSLKYEERLVVMPNDFSLVMQVAKTLVETTLPAKEKNRYHAILGLSEMINNAIEHGNLGITFEEKSMALKASRFYPLAIDRTHREPYKDRIVTVRSRVFPQLRRIEYFVGDQGDGFDWRALPDPKDKQNLLNRHGRGIMMARYAFDEIIYNEKGNEVTLALNLDTPGRVRRT
jgi:ActR/RegA family two-component response regulator